VVRDDNKMESENPVVALSNIATRAEKFVGSAKKGSADGRGEKAQFNSLKGICWNPNDQCFYVCCDSTIRKITLQGEVSTLVRQGLFSSKVLKSVQGIAVHNNSNTLYILNEGIAKIFEGKINRIKVEIINFFQEQ